MDKQKFKEIYDESRNGANDFFFNPLYRKMAYSDGVRDLAEVGCYWLLDIIGTECLQPLRKSGAGTATVEVNVKDSKAHIALLTQDDAPPVWSRDMTWTDMPEGRWVFLLCDEGQRFTLILLRSIEMDGCFYDGPTVPKAPLRVEVLLAEMQTVLDQIRPDPLAAWMSRQGFDPRLGGRLLLPTDLKPELGPFPPHYVLFVEHTAQPVLILAGIYNSIPSTYTVEQP